MENMLYKLECIEKMAENIREAIGKGKSMSIYSRHIDMAYDLLEELSDRAVKYLQNYS